MQKIVRVSFSLNGSDKEYFMDRMYNEEKDDQTNCDESLAYLVNAVKEGEAIAIMKESRQKPHQPVLINLKNVMEINILNVAVYQTKPAKDVQAE
jgi:hypothetical protein